MAQDLLHDAQTWWAQTFNNTAYTNFTQVEFLVGKSGASWPEVLHDPKLLSKRIRSEDVHHDQSHQFNLTWASAGRCTSFAIRVARQLQEGFDKDHHKKYFDFRFYDLKRHRVARCAKTGILIDSSSAVGIVVLKDGEWARLEDQHWKWIAGKSKFERNGQMKASSDELTVRQCMTTCLVEVRDHFEPLCLFRSFAHGKAHFHGLVKWIPKAKQLHLIKDLRTKATTVIYFDRSGTIDSDKSCRAYVGTFVEQYGGPHGRQQWGTAGRAHMELWGAAHKVWGYAHMK